MRAWGAAGPVRPSATRATIISSRPAAGRISAAAGGSGGAPAWRWWWPWPGGAPGWPGGQPPRCAACIPGCPGPCAWGGILE